MGLLNLCARTLLVAVLAAIVSLSAQPVRAADSGGGFGLKPAHIDPEDPATRSYFRQSQPPGGTFGDQVVVQNEGSQPRQFYVNPVDGLTGQTTGSVYANRQDPVRGAGAWVTPDVPQVMVPPHRTASVGFTVRVPPNAPPGDHLAGIAFQDVKTTSNGGAVGITQVIRSVMGVLTQVKGPARPFALGIDGLALQPLSLTSGQPAIMVGLTDRGQVLGKPALSVTLDGPSGYRRSASRQLDTLLPTDSITYPFAWPDTLGPGSYHACASGGLPGGSQTRRCQTLTVQTPYTPQVNTSPTAAARPPVWLWLLLPLGLAAVVGAFLLGRGSRGRGGSGGGASGRFPWPPWKR